MSHMVRSIILVAVVGGSPLATLVAQTPQPAGKPTVPAASQQTAPPRNYVRLASMNGFTIDYPRDWQVLIGVGSSLAVMVSKARDAAVAVERVKLAVALSPSEIIDDTAELEKQELQRRQPQATNFSHQFQPFGSSKVIIIDYRQLGSQGPEHVRVYNVIRGTDKYRLLCTTRLQLLDKYKDMFQQIAFSLAPNSSQ
jgi:hypothetical protein